MIMNKLFETFQYIDRSQTNGMEISVYLERPSQLFEKFPVLERNEMIVSS